MFKKYTFRKSKLEDKEISVAYKTIILMDGTMMILPNYMVGNKFKIILDYINNGKGVAPKPYKIISMEDNKVLLEGKLNNDDYVIVSLAKSLTKINFNFKNKFIFVPRLENVSGTKIRELVSNGQVDQLDDMLPQETIDLLKEEMSLNHAPLHETRAYSSLLNNVNSFSKEELMNLNLIDSDTVENILSNRPFDNVDDLLENITQGFSTHRKQRILSVLEVGIFKDEVHKYINNYLLSLSEKELIILIVLIFL